LLLLRRFFCLFFPRVAAITLIIIDAAEAHHIMNKCMTQCRRTMASITCGWQCCPLVSFVCMYAFATLITVMLDIAVEKHMLRTMNRNFMQNDAILTVLVETSSTTKMLTWMNGF
jgi:hypothetical protein